MSSVLLYETNYSFYPAETVVVGRVLLAEFSRASTAPVIILTRESGQDSYTVL